MGRTRCIFGKNGETTGAMLVLPTGAGKTVTALKWLFGRMARDSELRVLWLSHQQASVDQTVLEARAVAREQRVDFQRRARAIHSAAGESGTLTDNAADFAAVTFQTLTKAHKARVKSWFTRPVFVVVDEAHHAGSETYRELLTRLARYETCRGFLGLSATPTPVLPQAAASLRRRFPVRAHEVTLSELIHQGILARPRFHQVRTHYRPTLDEDQAKALARQRDIPGDVLFDVGNEQTRNQIVVDEYLSAPDRWEKTLIFTVDIDMANAIADALVAEGIEARRIHSRLQGETRDDQLEWFRGARDNVVLVAVSMLNEGVDLPDAKTAFLARPTKNRTLLKQMVGRVLRGTPAGGSAEAHVVDFRDDWPSLARILGPEDAIDTDLDGVTVPSGIAARPDDLPPALEGALRLLFEDQWQEPTDEGTPAPAGAVALESSRLTNLALVGYYELEDDDVRIVPVLEHQRDAFRAFADRASDSRRIRSLEAFFAELPEPIPPHEQLKALRRGLLAGAARYHGLELGIGPRVAVERIQSGDVRDRGEQLRVIHDVHETTPARLTHPSLRAFREEVDRLLDEGLTWRDRSIPSPAKPNLTRIELLETRERPLGPLLKRVASRGVERLSYELRPRLGDLPAIHWTDRVIQFAYGYHRFDRTTGKQLIRISRLLCAPKVVVADELLEFLVWHELLHHILLRQGHDAQFVHLEQAWPGAAELDGELAMFHEMWNTDPAAYR